MNEMEVLRRPKSRICVLVLVLALSSCQSNNPDAPLSSPFATASEAVSTKPPINIEHSTPTATSAPTATSVVVPVFQDNDDHLDWLFSIKQSGQCDLPCWWGIEPGTATVIGVEELLSPFDLSRVQGGLGFPDGFRGYAADLHDDKYGTLSIGFWVQDGIIEGISVSPDVTSRQLIKEPIREAFFLDSILMNYGPPSNVYVHLISRPPEQSSTWVYEVWLVYEERGAYLRYYGRYTLPGENDDVINVCLGDQSLLAIEFSIFSSHDSALAEAIEDLDIAELVKEGNLIKWQEATNLSVNDFTNMFSTGREACFDSPIGIWNQ